MFVNAVFLLSFLFVFCGHASALPIEALPNQDSPPDIVVVNYPLPKIPSDPVHIFIRQGTESRFELFFIDARYDYDINDFEFYKAWCLIKDKPIRRNAMHEVMVYNCYGNHPLHSVNWNKINYILNHKRGTKTDIQLAIWFLANNQVELPPIAKQLVAEADQNFVPTEGEIIAVIIIPSGKQQPVLIEHKIPASVFAFDTAPAFFAPMEAASVSWYPLLAIPAIIIPFVPTDHPYVPYNPPENPPIPTPEPATFIMFGVGLVAMIGKKVLDNVKQTWYK